MAKPPKEQKEDGAKRHWLSARTTAELNQSLKDAAQKSGRSVSQEIEFRLEQSFRAERIEAEAKEKFIPSPDVQSDMLFKSIRNSAIATMTHMRASWVDDVYARAAVRQAIFVAFKSYTDVRKLSVSQSDFDFGRLQGAERVGAAFGRLLGDLSGSPGGDALLQEVREVLAPAASTLGETSIPEDLRRDAALSDLDVSIAA